MTVAKLQALLSDFDMDAEVHFGYPCIDNYGGEYQGQTRIVLVEEHVASDTGTVSPILFLNGSELLED